MPKACYGPYLYLLLVLTAQAVFLSECGHRQTDRQTDKLTDAADHPTSLHSGRGQNITLGGGSWRGGLEPRTWRAREHEPI